MIKLFVLSLIYILVSLLGMVAAVSYNNVNLRIIDGVLVSFVGAAMIFNFVLFLVNVFKSEAYR